MRLSRYSVLFLFLLCAPYMLHAQVVSSDAVVNHTVAISQPVHFHDADGNDLTVPAGAYWVAPQDDALELFDVENGDTYVIRATSGTHTESLTADIAVSTPGTDVQPDVHSVAFLGADGSELVAEGTYSGIATRGLLGDARAKAAAARRAAQQRAQAAKQRAQAAAAAARQRAEQAIQELRSLAERFLNLSCEEKINAMRYVTDRVSSQIEASATQSANDMRAQRPIIDEVMQTIVEQAFAQDRPLIDTAIHMAAAARDPQTRATIDRLVTNATCGIDPEETAEQMSRLTSSLYQSAVAAAQGEVTTRGAVRDFMDDNVTVSFDVSGGLTVPKSKFRSKTGGAGVGIAAGARGNPPCTNPHQDRVCVRAFFYRHIGGSTPEGGIAIPVAVGIWRVNPRDLQGRYTNIGGSVSFETIAAIYGAATGAATVASGGAAAPTTLGTIAGLTGIGFDVAFDRNIWSLVDCARANPNDWKTACRERPRAVGIIVNAGLSVSVAPLEVHRVSGSTWTWWWQDGGMTDVQGPTRLWKDAIDYARALRN